MVITGSVGWRGRLPRAVLLAVVVSLTPLPVAAAEKRPAGESGPIKASIRNIAVEPGTAGPAKSTPTSRRARQSGPVRDGSFLKSRPGLLALAVMVAGVGYALYSTQNDRITSPGKE